jgi:pre-mRNA-splicing factor SPF27
MKNEFERIEKEELMPKFDMSRYELPEPSITKQKDLASWQKTVENSFTQLESQDFRILDLKLLESYGSEAWKTYNNILNKLFQDYKKKQIDKKRETHEINYERKTSQEKAGDKLKHLEKNWVNLVSKNFEIEQACLNLNNELKMLEKYNQFNRPGQEIDENEPKLKRQKTNINQDDGESEDE